MRICGFAAEGLRSERLIHETFPSKELQDYWATRPHYEEVNTKSGDFVSGSSSEGGEGGQSYQNWLASQKDNKDELPPPPYSLEAEEAASLQAEGPQSQGAGSSQLPTDATIASLSSNLSHQSLSSSSLALDATSSSITRPPLHPSHPSHPSRTSSASSGIGSSSSVSPPPVHPSRPRPPEPNRLSRPQSVSVSRPQTVASPGSNQQPPSSVPHQPYQSPLSRPSHDQLHT